MTKDLIMLIMLDLNMLFIGIVSVIWFDRPYSIIMYCFVSIVGGYLLGVWVGLFQSKEIVAKAVAKEFKRLGSKI